MPSATKKLGSVVLLSNALLLLLPNIVFVAVARDTPFASGPLGAFVSAFLPSALIVVVALGVFGRRPWLPLLILLPFSIFVVPETAYVLQYGEPSSYGIVATVTESNRREIFDFLGGAVWPLAAAVLINLCFALFSLVYLRRSHYQWRGRTRDYCLVISVVSVAAVAIFSLQSSPSTSVRDASKAAANPTTDLTPGELWPAWASIFESGFPVGIPLRVAHYVFEWREMRAQVNVLRDFKFGVAPPPPIATKQIYVLVIGETGRRDRWQLYGYGRETTPLLSKQTNLIKFEDFITPTSASRTSVPVIVSRKPGTEIHDFFKERSIVQAFKEAGFQTYWISNQVSVGEFDSPIATVAYEAEHVSFLNFVDWTKPGTYDEVLLPALSDAIEKGGDKVFVVLHTLGSHANYALRYPPSFDYFKPSLGKQAASNLHDISLVPQIRNTYDNSIRYTDFFLSRVIGILDRTGSATTMWYTSDHGEDFVSPECAFVGHGSGTEYNFELPSVFWYSDAYAMAFPQQLAQLKLHAGDRLTTEYIFESLVDMAGLDFPGHDRARSVFSEQMTFHQRMTRAFSVADFDNSARSAGCHMLIPK